MKKENQEEPILFSPVNLLYSAYTNDRLPVSCVIDEEMGKYLSLIPENTRAEITQVFCNIYMENERVSFLEGLRTGVRLMRELEEQEQLLTPHS